MELDYKFFMARLVALEKDIKEYKSECATLAPIMWQYRYLRLRCIAIKSSISSFKELQLRFEMNRSVLVSQRVFKVLDFRPDFELLHAINRYQELNSQLFDGVNESDLPF